MSYFKRITVEYIDSLGQPQTFDLKEVGALTYETLGMAFGSDFWMLIHPFELSWPLQRIAGALETLADQGLSWTHIK